MEDYLTNELGKTGVTIESLGDIVILNLGDEVVMVDLVSLWSIIEGIKKKTPEWQFLLNANQLIIDFTKVYFVDLISNEFVQIAEEYKR